jgi:carboxypeptidase Taq
MTPTDALRQLVHTLTDISTLDSIGSVLSWDEHTYLPPGASDHRANQNALVARLSHERFTSPRIGEWLDTLQGSDLVAAPDSDPAVILRETRRSYDRARKLPTSLVEEMSRTASLGYTAWVQARKDSHFATFEPWLDKTLKLKRQEADCYGWKQTPYDALLEGFEPGATTAEVQRIFDSFRKRLVDLIARIAGSSKKAPVHLLERTYPIPLQDKLARQAAVAFGYDFDTGRLDLTVHPFCTGIGPGDTRITTRFRENYFDDAFFSVLHEVGHALYEQGLPKKQHFGTPLAEAISLGIHESQSRMWENLVGRSRAFWKFFFPKFRDTFGETVKDITPDQWLFAINNVQPSFIRVESDETTYNLHIMLRFELEQLLLTDQIKPHDLPSVWNDRMKQYLGITPPDDRQGCLQDVHWSGGAFGYFPTYSLGNLYGAQFFDQARKDLGDLDGMFARGECAPLLSWLRDKIHRHGKRYRARDLVKRVTGSDLSAEPLMRELEQNAREFYGV